MAFDFPNAPTPGQVYNGYTWDGEKWIAFTAGVQQLIIASDTAPTAAADNSLWLETDTGILYFKWNDGNSSQWVAIGGATGTAVLFVSQSLVPSQQAQARANIGVLKKNYIVNGGMQVSQENGVTAGPPTTPGYYATDQFLAIKVNSTAVLSIAQVASFTPGGSPNRIRATVTTATAMGSSDAIYFENRVEGIRTVDLRFGSVSAKTVTLQFGVKAPAGTYGVALANSATNRCYIAEYVVAAGEANTDVIKTVVVPGDTTGTWLTDTGIGLVVRWALTLGSSLAGAPGWGTANTMGTANQFNFGGTNGNIFELFDVGLYEGAVAPPFMVPDYASELTLCMRYWQKYSSVLVYAPYAPAGGATYNCTPMAVPMRIAPTAAVLGTPFYSNASNATMNVVNAGLFRFGCTITAAGPGYADIAATLNARL